LSTPLEDAPTAVYKFMQSGAPIAAEAGTPLQRLAEFTRSEVNAIRDFAQQQGVNVPIVATGPGFESGYFSDSPGPLRTLMMRLRGVSGDDIREITPHIGLSQSSVPAAMHEIGHATPIAGSDTLRRLFQGLAKGLGSSSTLGHAVRAGIAMSALAPPDDDSSAAHKFVYNNAPALVAATMVPELAEEARASYHALRGAGDAGVSPLKMLAELGPGFATYLAAAAAPVVATVFARKIVDALRSAAQAKHDQEKTSAAMPGAEVKAPGALRASADSAWRVGGNPPKPKTIPPATMGATGAPAKAREQAKPPSKQGFYTDMLSSLYNPGRGARLATG
jgi:hypothetical protein